MNEDFKIWVSIIVSIVIVILMLLTYSLLENQQKYDLIKSGVNPIEVSCAFEGKSKSVACAEYINSISRGNQK